MLNLTYTDRPDFGQYSDNIRATGTSIYVDPVKYHISTTYFRGQYVSAEERLKDYIRVMSQGTYRDTTPDIVRVILQDYCGIDPKKFRVRKQGSLSISMDMQKVVLPLLDSLRHWASTGSDIKNTMAYVLLSAYREYAYYKIKAQNSIAKEKKFIPTDLKTKKGMKLSEIPFTYERQSTSRYYTRNDNVQAYDLLTVNSFTVPEDYVLVWADFSQIDFRVAYHIILREIGSKYDEFYREYEDKYEATMRAICLFCNIPFDAENFEANRKGFKTSILARVYGAGMNTISLNFKDPELVVMLDKYITSNVGHQAYREAISRAIEFGIEVVSEDYFGVTRAIPISTAGYSVMDSALNAPIQTTSNSIIVHWTNNTIQQFRERGWNESKVRVFLIRHDETLYMVHKDAIKRDGWIFKNTSEVQIDDWSPLQVRLEMGYYYTEPDEDVTSLYIKSCQDNEHLMTPLKIMPSRPGRFQPIRDVLYVYCYTPSTLEGFANVYLSGSDLAAKISSLPDEESRMIWLDEEIKSGRINSDTPLWYFRKYFDKYIVYQSDKSHWCMVEGMGHVLGTALKNNCKFVDIRCVDVVFNTYQNDLYIKYTSSAASTILDLFREFESAGGVLNKWLPRTNPTYQR